MHSTLKKNELPSCPLRRADILSLNLCQKSFLLGFVHVSGFMKTVGKFQLSLNGLQSRRYKNSNERHSFLFLHSHIQSGFCPLRIHLFHQCSDDQGEREERDWELKSDIALCFHSLLFSSGRKQLTPGESLH